MLINFSVANFKSFRETQSFSLQAAKHTRLEDHVIPFDNERFLKCGIVFGANAAGKSNFIRAINFAKNIVLDGIIPSEISNSYFKIDDFSMSAPGEFNFIIVKDKSRYKYGFAISYTECIIISEWLFIQNRGSEKCIFKRLHGKKTTSELRIKDKNNRQRFEIYSDDVPDNKTMISEFSRHKLQEIDEFKPFFDVYSWFKDLIIIFPESVYNGYTQFISNDNKRNSLVNLLAYFDTGIESISGDEKSIDKVFEFLPEKIRNKLILELSSEFNRENSVTEKTADISINNKRISISRNNDGTLIARQLMMNHGNSNELFDLGDESDGTRRLFDLIPVLGKTIEDRVIFIDELDRSFHTKLTQEFLTKFFEFSKNTKSQLVFSTHDINILSLKFFRQDEIWFAERQPDHSTKIYSLKTYRERFDKDIAKEYLLGKYGALPQFIE